MGSGEVWLYHSLKKYLSLFASVLLIFQAGCSGGRPGIDITEKKYETDTSLVEIQIPRFKNFQNEEFAQELNTEYDNAVEDWLGDFSEECEKNSSGVEKCTFRLTQEIMLDVEPLLSVVGEVNVFTQGVHPSSSRVAKNIDTAQSKVLTLPDLFSDDAYTAVIDREINEILEKNPEEYHDLWEKPMLSSMHREFFFLSEEGLVIFFPPYELSYYARGFVDFCIPYAELSGYLKPEYRFLADI